MCCLQCSLFLPPEWFGLRSVNSHHGALKATPLQAGPPYQQSGQHIPVCCPGACTADPAHRSVAVRPPGTDSQRSTSFSVTWLGSCKIFSISTRTSDGDEIHHSGLSIYFIEIYFWEWRINPGPRKWQRSARVACRTPGTGVTLRVNTSAQPINVIPLGK